MNKKATYIIILLLGIACQVSAQGLTLYVAPDGNDQATGTSEKPLKSMAGARDRIRSLRLTQAFTDTLHVIIKPGHYYLPATFTLYPADSGTPEAPVVYEAPHGKTAIFSGGMQLSGFQETDSGLWVTRVPEVARWGWTFDQLYVNSRRAVCAKSPNSGYYYLKNVKENVWYKGTGRIPEKALQTVQIDRDADAQLQGLSQDDLQQVVMTTYHKWNITKRHIDKYDADSAMIYTLGEGMKPWNAWKPHTRFILDNYLAALDTAGEWYLSKEGMLYYHPLPGETLEQTTFMAPILPQLVKLEGQPAAGRFVHDVIFRNLSFEHAEFYLPESGFEPYQAAITIDAAVELNGAENISFQNCGIAHTGGYGLWMNKGVRHCTVRHSYLHDLGAGGIRIGELDIRQDTLLQTGGNTIENCIIQSGGFEFAPGVGVLIGQSADNRIIHNDIADFRYTGVSVGWRWGYDFSPAKNNKILYNHIHHIGWGVLSDMAGVYTLGPSAGTEVSHNHVHDIYAFDYGGWGLYTDEGSSDIRMENNLVHHTKTGGFHQHYGKDNIINNNIFAFSKMYQVQATRVEDHRSFVFSHNIVLYDQGRLLQGRWTKLNADIDHNLYWNLKGEVIFPSGNIKSWQGLGHDKHSILADPQFINPGSNNFKFKSNKSIRKIGFKPFDYSNYGVTGSPAWQQKAVLAPDILQQFHKLFE